MANRKNLNSHTGYQVCHMNVRSLLRHKDEVAIELSTNEIICLTETWLNNKIIDKMLAINLYNFVRIDRDDSIHEIGVKGRGGGLMIYYKEIYTPYITCMSKLNKISKHIEQLWIKIERPGRKRLYIGNVYRPPDGKVDNFIQYLKMSVDELYSIHRNQFDLIILGDFNIDFAKTRDPDRRVLKAMIDDLDLTQLISAPTRITNKCKSTIDLILTNIDKQKIQNSGVLNITISDHLPVFVHIKRPKLKSKKVAICSRSYNLYSYTNIENMLTADANWIKFWAVGNDIEELLSIKMDIVLNNINILCPLRKSLRRLDQQPWVDKELLTAITLKKKLHKMFLKSNNSSDAWNMYKQQKSHVHRLIVTKRRLYITSTLNDNRDDPKKFWKEINTHLYFGKKSGASGSIVIKDENEIIKNEIDTANTINLHYATIGEKLAEKLKSNSPLPYHVAQHPLPLHYQPMTFRFITIKETTSLIKSLKNSKPSGIPNLKTPILKDALTILNVELTYILNECLDKSYVPNCWKKGMITPIPKIANCSHPIDYRPITVLTATSKILERAVYNQLVYYLESNGILDCRQHGFRRDHSTLSAIYDVTQHLYYNMDQRNITYCAFIDYSKAFDTLNHDALFYKLKHIGIGPQVLDWCRCYLTGRKQSVKNGETISDEITVTCGVPQGSILGPLFFIIYVNDMLQLFSEDDPKITLYADDTVMYVSGNDSHIVCNKLDHGLAKLHNWCVANKLSINLKKTKLLIVDPLKICETYPQPKLDTQILDRVNSYNYLGVSIDENLTFEKFLREKYGKIHCRVHQLGKIRKYIESHTACLIYKQMILSLSDYADVMIKSGPQGGISRIGKLQEKAVKIIDNNCHRRLSTDALMHIYRIHPISQRQDEHLCTMMYRLSKNQALLNHDRPRVHLRCRQKVKFKTYKRVYEKYLKSPLSRGISLWDRLPEAVQKSTTKFKFKKAIQDIMY